MHTHTHFSHDSKQDPEGSCIAAMEKGLSGLAFSDHADMWYYNERKTLEHIVASDAAASALREKYMRKLEIIRGIEIGDAYFDPTVTSELVARIKPDMVIGSIHCLSYAGLNDAYSQMDLSENAVSHSELMRLMNKYLELVTDIAEHHDIDVLAHLTCPFRYANGKYGRKLTDTEFEQPIKNILNAVIRREIALEINTSGIGTPLNEAMPSERIVSWYRKMGGRLITLGSDAHSAERIGNGFDTAREMLLRNGFTECVYYKERTAIAYSIA